MARLYSQVSLKLDRAKEFASYEAAIAEHRDMIAAQIEHEIKAVSRWYDDRRMASACSPVRASSRT